MTATHDVGTGLWERARSVLPRGASSGHRVGWEQVIVRARGAYVWDTENRRYLDYLLAWGPIILGHCDPRVNEAVQRAAATCDLTGVGPQLHEIEAAEAVSAVMPSAGKVAFCTSGTDATMHAVHLVRAATGRRKVLKFHGAYHGWHDQLAVGSARADSTPESPMTAPNGGGLHADSLADVILVEWNDRAGVMDAFDAHRDAIAGVFCEPYVHSFGCVPAEPGFLELLRQLCTEQGAALVFDEIKTGFRAAIGGYQSVCGVTPDLTAFGKAVANGYNVAGIAGSDAIMGYLGAYRGDRATIDGTYNAAPYAMAAVTTTVRLLQEEDVIPRIHALGERLRTGLASAVRQAGVEACVVGFGSEWCLYFRAEPPTNFREALDIDTGRYSRYHAGLLSRGVLEPQAPIGDRRLCAATTDSDVDRSLEAAIASLAETT
jgi:glutamate-1-semialdehyde 2,1-aminomutase